MVTVTKNKKKKVAEEQVEEAPKSRFFSESKNDDGKIYYIFIHIYALLLEIKQKFAHICYLSLLFF